MFDEVMLYILSIFIVTVLYDCKTFFLLVFSFYFNVSQSLFFFYKYLFNYFHDVFDNYNLMFIKYSKQIHFTDKYKIVPGTINW